VGDGVSVPSDVLQSPCVLLDRALQSGQSSEDLLLVPNLEQVKPKPCGAQAHQVIQKAGAVVDRSGYRKYPHGEVLVGLKLIRIAAFVSQNEQLSDVLREGQTSAG
jgi:hypothetical protein